MPFCAKAGPEKRKPTTGGFVAWMRGLGLASPRGAEGRPAPVPSVPTSLFAQDHGASGSPSFRLIANLQGLS